MGNGAIANLPTVQRRDHAPLPILRAASRVHARMASTVRANNILATVLARVHAATDALVAAGALPAGIDRSR
ncbi:MAG: hypothetical protein ACJ8DY_22700, partial [Xanthobacteraceae bacterium]